MSNIYIVGIVASGKTTLAKQLSVICETPWYELDCIVHQETETGRYKRTPEEQIAVIQEINQKGDWIIEGTYRESCHCLLEMADHIIFLDTPLWKRRVRILTRFVRQQLHIETCHYQSNFKMLRLMYQWTNDFEKNRGAFIDMLMSYQQKLVIEHNKKEINRHFREIVNS